MDTSTTRTDDPAIVVGGLPGAVLSLLHEAGITRHEAAIRTGIPRETFYRKCSGVGKAFDADEQKLIADLLGIKVSQLWIRAEAA